MDINEVVKRHGKSVALVFKRRGIKLPVTNSNVMLQTILGKDDFINDLVSEVEKDLMYTGSNGDTIVPSPNMATNLLAMFNANKAAGNTKPVFNAEQTLDTVVVKSKTNKLKNTLTDLLSVVGSGLGAYMGAKNNNTSTATQPYVYAPNNPAPEEKKKPNYLLIGGIILIVILGAALIFKKDK